MSQSPPSAPGILSGSGRSELSVGISVSALAVTVWGASSVIAKLVDMGAMAIVGYRFLMYGIVVSLVLVLRRTPITLAGLRHSLWGGLFLGVDAGLFFTAVKLTTVANATIINALQVLLVSFVSARYFGERMRRSDAGYAALAMVGVTVVALGSAGSGAWSLAGDMAAVGALFGWSAYFVATRQAQAKVPTQEYTVCVALYTGAINMPLAAIFGQDLSWPSGENWGWLAVMAFGSGLGGHTAMNWSLKRVPLWLASTLTLMIPVVASALAWVLFDEALSPLQMVAMAVVVVSLSVIVRNQARSARLTRSGPAARTGPDGGAGGG